MATKWKNIIEKWKLIMKKWKRKENIKGIFYLSSLGVLVMTVVLAMQMHVSGYSIQERSEGLHGMEFTETESFQKEIEAILDTINQVYTGNLAKHLEEQITDEWQDEMDDSEGVFQSNYSCNYEYNREKYTYSGWIKSIVSWDFGMNIKYNIINEICMQRMKFHYFLRFDDLDANFTDLVDEKQPFWRDAEDLKEKSGIWIQLQNGNIDLKNKTEHKMKEISQVHVPKMQENVKYCLIGFEEEEIDRMCEQWKAEWDTYRLELFTIVLLLVVSVVLFVVLRILKINIPILRAVKAIGKRVVWLTKKTLYGIRYYFLGLITGERWYANGYVQTELRRGVVTLVLAVGMMFGEWFVIDIYGLHSIRVDAVNLGIAIVVGLYVIGTVLNMKSYKRVWDGIEGIVQGEFEVSSIYGEQTPFYNEVNSLAKIGEGFEKNMENRIKAERTKMELVTNVSHDLKTPLTSIISYIDLLDRMEELPHEAREYVHILEKKADRLKAIVADVFELAKTASGEIKLEICCLSANKLLQQTLAAMEDRIKLSGLQVRLQETSENYYILADGQRMYRVLQNLIDNALKYSLKGTRIYIIEELVGDTVCITIKNTANYEMEFTEEEVMERFFCGDRSRNTEGNGLGLSIAQGFTLACGGNFDVVIDGDQFKVILSFPLQNEMEVEDVKDIQG